MAIDWGSALVGFFGAYFVLFLLAAIAYGLDKYIGHNKGHV